MRKITVLSLVLALGPTGATAAEWGIFAPTPYIGARPPGPVHTSRVFVIEAPATNESAELAVPLDTPNDAFGVVLGAGPVRARAEGRALARRRFDEPELASIDLPSDGVRFGLDALPPGTHTLQLDGVAGAAIRFLVAQPRSPLALHLQLTPLAAHAGDTVLLDARIDDDESPRQVVVTALLGDRTITLRDDGVAPDRAAGDGVYSGTFAAPAIGAFGEAEVRVDAAGTRANGQPFRRTASAAVMVTTPRTAIEDGTLSAGADAVTMKLMPASGRFRVEILYAVAGKSFAWAREEITAGGTDTPVAVPRPQVALAADRALVRVLNLDTLGVEDEKDFALTPLAGPPDFAGMASPQQGLPAPKARAAQRFGEDQRR